MHSLSVKELRKNFPIIRQELRHGETFLIIYKSKPIARLTPVDDIPSFEEASEEDVEKASLSEWSKDYLTKEELKYYLSLKS